MIIIGYLKKGSILGECIQGEKKIPLLSTHQAKRTVNASNTGRHKELMDQNLRVAHFWKIYKDDRENTIELVKMTSLFPSFVYEMTTKRLT